MVFEGVGNLCMYPCSIVEMEHSDLGITVDNNCRDFIFIGMENKPFLIRILIIGVR